MSRTGLASLTRLVSTTTNLNPAPLPLLARTYSAFSHQLSSLSRLRQSTVDTPFGSNARSFSTTPFTSARVCFTSEFAPKFRSSQSESTEPTRESKWAKIFRERGERQANRAAQKRAERARKHQECEAHFEALRARIHDYLRPLYRLRFRNHRRRSPNWRPARLCFRTPNLSGVFRSKNRCTEEAERRLKLCRRFPTALLDDRRRHHPQRRAHFKYAIKLVQSEVALHFSQGSQAWRHDLKNHARLCPKRAYMERVEARLNAKSGGGGGGGGASRHQEGGGGARAEQREKARYQHNHPRDGHDRFDYSTFRRAYWYSKTHSSSRPYNHSREWRRRAKRLQFARAEVWVLKKPGAVRRRTAMAYFTMNESPSARRVQGVEGRGGNGGVHGYVPVVKSVQVQLPSFVRTSSILRPSIRPHISLPVKSSPCLLTRAFSSSRPRLGVHFLVPLATALKSTEALHVLVWVTRLSLTLLPLSVRSKAIFALRERYVKDPSSLTATIFSRLASTYYSGSIAQPSGFLSRWNALVGLPLLLLSPFLLLGLVGFASLERTPVTGRWRFVMLSPTEEEELVEGILSVGRTAQPATTSHVHNGQTHAVAPEGTSLDWVAILRQVLNLPDEGVDPETGRRMLLGGVVLDQRDWRLRWTEAVLRALEKGVVEGLTRGGAGAKGEGEALRPPPFKYPLEGRMGTAESGWKEELIMSKHLEGHQSGADLQVEYDILVIDRDENNAFSFGFSPEAGSGPEKGRRGVIVVYTGFLKEVLGETALPSRPASPSPSHHPNRLASFFSKPSNASGSQPDPSLPDAIASYLVPTTLPTQEQCKSLAVLLSHETSHLILSHTLESYASMNLLMPHLSRLASDVLRTLLYPVTAILGPFINDAVGRSLNEGAKGGFGLFGNAANSCESRKLESEADLVALRLLAGSGIDPRFALDFWENRLSNVNPTSSSAPSTTLPFSQTTAIHHHSKNDDSSGMLDGYMRTHPVDQERLEKIRAELKSWEDWNRSLDAGLETN